MIVLITGRLGHDEVVFCSWQIEQIQSLKIAYSDAVGYMKAALTEMSDCSANPFVSRLSSALVVNPPRVGNNEYLRVTELSDAASQFGGLFMHTLPSDTM